MKSIALILFLMVAGKGFSQNWFESTSVTRGGTTYTQKLSFYSFGGSKTVASESSAPDIPTLLTPANNSYSAPLSPTLDWSDAATATSYDLLVDNNSDFSSPIITTSSASSTYTVVVVLDCETHYWKVRATNGYGSSAYSSAFTLDTRTAILTLTQPSNGATGVNSFDEVLFEWSNPGGVVDYTFQLASDIGFTSLLVDSREGIEEYLLTAGSLEPLTTYYWRVASNNDNSCIRWSSTFSFTTGI